MPTTEIPASGQLERCQGRLLGKLRRTARRWPVLPEGERMVLAVSGGTDSMAMAYLVAQRNRRLLKPMALSAIHARLDADGGTTGPPKDSVRWFDAQGGAGTEGLAISDAGTLTGDSKGE